MLTTRYRDDLPPAESFRGIEVRRVPYWIRVSRTHYSWRIVGALWRALRHCDVVVVNSPFSNVLPAAVLTRVRRRRLVIFHQGDLVLPRHRAFPVSAVVLEKCFDVFTVPAMALAHVVSTYTWDYARHSRVMTRFAHKCRPFVPAPLIEASPPRAAATRTRRVGFAGRFVDEKGFDILLDAIPRVVERMPGTRFVFAGDTDLRYENTYARLRNRIDRVAAHVDFLGLLGEDDLRDFYRGLDVFVLSSRSECFALTQAEAALLGVPVVATDVPGARMLVRETGFGELVPPGDPPALADGIVRVLAERGRYLSRYENVPRFFVRHGRPDFD